MPPGRKAAEGLSTLDPPRRSPTQDELKGGDHITYLLEPRRPPSLSIGCGILKCLGTKLPAPGHRLHPLRFRELRVSGVVAPTALGGSGASCVSVAPPVGAGHGRVDHPGASFPLSSLTSLQRLVHRRICKIWRCQG